MDIGELEEEERDLGAEIGLVVTTSQQVNTIVTSRNAFIECLGRPHNNLSSDLATATNNLMDAMGSQVLKNGWRVFLNGRLEELSEILKVDCLFCTLSKD